MPTISFSSSGLPLPFSLLKNCTKIKLKKRFWQHLYGVVPTNNLFPTWIYEYRGKKSTRFLWKTILSCVMGTKDILLLLINNVCLLILHKSWPIIQCNSRLVIYVSLMIFVKHILIHIGQVKIHIYMVNCSRHSWKTPSIYNNLLGLDGIPQFVMGQR
jgi:hypothetical protein